MKNLLLIAFLHIANSAFAFNIEGVVYNTNNKSPLDECKVLLLQNGKVVKSVTTNFEGKFSIEVNKNQNYILEFLKSSYKIESKKIFTNQEFLNSNSTIVVHLSPLSLHPKFNEMKEGTIKKVPNPDVMEDIGDLSLLPEGYKLIEAKPLKFNEKENSRFNVQQKDINNQSIININEFKAAFNKESLEANIYSDKEKFPSSFYVEGNIYYGFGKVLLTKEVKEILDGIAQKLISDQSTKLNIKAYADAEREVEVGNEVSKLRAEEIIKYLMDQNVEFSKLNVIIIGNEILENGCYKGVSCTEFQHQENRRVELIFQNH